MDEYFRANHIVQEAELLVLKAKNILEKAIIIRDEVFSK